MKLEEITTPTQFIQWLWESNNYFDTHKTVSQIEKLASSKGFTFSLPAIRMALERSKFITRAGKLANRVPLYKQIYPATKKEFKVGNPKNKILESLGLHSQIKKVSSRLFYDGYHTEAVFAAFKKVNNMVKKKSGVNKDGKDLMLTVFSVKSPILKVNKMKTDSEKDEQEGYMHIFAGSMHGIRNPRAHEDEIKEDPMKAIEYLCLASLLAKTVDKTRKT